MNKSLPSAIIWTVTALVLAAWITHSALSTPLVTFSNSTKQCVQVEPASAGDCDRMPPRYSKQWSK